jgi:hypothetical protein
MTNGEANTEPVLPEPAIVLSIDLPMVSGGAVKKQAFYSAAQYQAAYQAGLKAGREHERKLIGVLVENCKDFDEFAAAIRSLHGGAAETARSGEDEVQ